MKIHFIGIGGIGLSALAKLLANDGHQISGSDIKQTEITNDLALNFGAKITIPHHEDAVCRPSHLFCCCASEQSRVPKS